MSEFLQNYKLAASRNQFKDFINTHVNTDHGVMIDFGRHFGEGQFLLVWRSSCGKLIKYSNLDRLLSENTCNNYKLARLSDTGRVNTFQIRSDYLEILQDSNPVKLGTIPMEDLCEILGNSNISGYLDEDFMNRERSDEEMTFGDVEALREYTSVPTHSNSQPQTQTQEQTQGTKMTTTTTATTVAATSKFAAIVERTKNAGTSAVQYQAGKALNSAVMAAVKPRLPMMVRGYAEHPAAPIVAAIAMAFAAEFLPEGAAKVKVVKATDLMLCASFMEGADKFFDVEKLVAGVFAKLPPEALAALENPSA